MSREEQLAARIRQLKQRPEDVERAAEKLRLARLKNKGRFDRTHQLRPKKIEEGDWVLVYDSSLDNQHRAMQKFARRTYHLAELDETRMGPTLSRSSTGRE